MRRILFVLLAFASIGFAMDCSVDDDCPYGYVCKDSECFADSLTQCNSFCTGDVAYQTAYSSSKGCWIAARYPCTYGCDDTGPDCRWGPAPVSNECKEHADCPDVCEIDVESIQLCVNGKCVPSEAVVYCPDKGCATPQHCYKPEDKCEGVTCPDKCEGVMLYTNGTCSPSSGACEYYGTQCPQGCSADGLGCKGEVKGEIFYYDEKGQKVPIRFAMIELYAAKQGKILAWGHPATDGQGRFNWSDPKAFAPGNEISGTVYLNESMQRLYVSQESSPSWPIGIVFMDHVAASNASLGDFKGDLTGLKNKNLTGMARIYAFTQKAVDFKEKALNFTPTVRERVISFWSGGNRHKAEFYADSSAQPTGMTIMANSSRFNHQYLPDTVFHEYCHHIQDESQGASHSIAGSDHAGYYANPDSEWGLVEGWAEFCAVEMKRQEKLEKYGLYRIRGSMINLELDYRMDDKVFRDDEPWGAGMIEEMAIAGILVDLRDSTSDYGGIDDDHVALPLSTIWGAFHKRRDFGDGNGIRNVYTLRDFYLALKNETKGDQLLNSPYLRGSNLTNLDLVFVKHGAFQDLNNNGRWDDGEAVGYSGRGQLVRSDLEAVNGTGVGITVIDARGNPVTEGAAVHVSVAFEGNDSYLSYEYDVPLSEGNVYVPLPPREYNATMTMTAFQSGTSNEAEESFSLTTAEAYALITPDGELGAYLAEVPFTEVPCSSDYQCAYAESGDYCVSGTCAFEAPSASSGGDYDYVPEPQPEPEPEPCAPAVIMMALAASVLIVKSR
jgi:hypothetical protein